MENKKIKNKTINEDVWTDECEKLLAEWSEKASCYRWLHGRSEKSYQRWYYCFSIPVIILSTLTGAANVGMDSFVPAESKSLASAIVGGVNIFAGIVSTLQNFLKVAELMEGHRIAGVSWGKLQRNIAIELALDPNRRVFQSDFLKLSRAEYDRLIEAGPMIDDGIIAQFNKKFKNYEVSVPSICNGLDKCVIYKIDPQIKIDPNDFIEGIEDIVSEEEKNVQSNNIIITEKKQGQAKNLNVNFEENVEGHVEGHVEEQEENVEIVEEQVDGHEEIIEEQVEENILPVNLKDEKDLNVEVIINVKGESDEETEDNSDEINRFLDSIDENIDSPRNK
tara:strand:+ start:1240 stop:2247 length:1008 start_codon:yes stop_codon:yes gene_type:complete